MRLTILPIHLFLILFIPINLLSQSDELEYPFPDDYSALLNQKINTYQNYDYGLTKSYTIDLMNHAKKCEEDELILLSYTALEYYSCVFNKREDFETITIEADSVFKSIISSHNLSEFADYYFEHINNYSIYLFRKNRISSADTLITNAIHLLENNTFNYDTKNYYLSVLYQNLSSIKELQWNFSEGKSFLEKANNIEEKPKLSTAYINANLSHYHLKTGNYYEALDFAEIALKSYKKTYIDKPNDQHLGFYLLSLERLAKLHIILDNRDEAHNKLKELQKFALSSFPIIEVKYLQTSAQFEIAENRPNLALKNYQKCLKIQEEKLPYRINEKVEIQNSIAQLYHQQRQLDSTFHYLQQAIIELTNNSNLNDIEANPKNYERVVYKQLLLDILQYKSEFLLEKYAQNQDICDLIIAQQTSEAAQDLADKIRLDLSSRSDKEFFSKKGHKVYAQAMKIVSLLEKIEHSDANVAFAYRAMESSRALLLAEAVYQSNTKEFANIPNKLIDREETFKEQIIEKERQIFHLEQEGEVATNYREEKYKLQISFDDFTDSLKILHPDYYKLKFAVQPPDILALQADLKADNQTLVEYFVEEEDIYALIISSDQTKLKTWSCPSLTDKIKGLRKAIYAEKNYEKAPQDFVDYAHRLYQDLVVPLGDLPERLVIVPDGVLNYLPFDVLLTDLPKFPSNYNTHAYLLDGTQISYDYSATLRMQERKKANGKVDFMGFAPHYNQENSLATRGVGELKFNIEEVDSIQAFFGGIAYVGNAAVKQKFKDNYDRASIIHFAGHAVQEEINADFSHLLFSKNTKNNKENQMLIKEIYARHINAQMVVLSACNTGMGEIQRGEGMYSLGRAFSYAGAQSLVSTLWSVNDKSTKEIMILFYRKLKKGLTKDDALQEAKKEYIENNTHVASNPLYWAGFVAYGNMKSLDLDSKFWWKFW